MTDSTADGDEPSSEDVYEEMEPLEPYTTGELASLFSAPRDLVGRLLDKLAGEHRIRKKEPEPSRRIWIREPPANTCPDCGRTFEVKFQHPVLGSPRFCPRCGSKLSR